MEVFILWVVTTITLGLLRFNSFQYIMFSVYMLFTTYIYNVLFPTRMSIKHAILFSIIPNSILWYMAYKCNDFLWVYPYNWHSFIAIFLIYSYSLMYIALES